MKFQHPHLLGFALVCTSAALTGKPAASEPLPVAELVKDWTVEPALKGKKDDDKPIEYNTSGIACERALSSLRKCLVIDDELTFAEWVSLEDQTIVPDREVEMVGVGTPFGAPPRLDCMEQKKPKEMDGEAVAENSGVFYVIGSHGCGRGKGAFRASAFLFGRVEPGKAPALSYRMSEALQACPAISEFYGKFLQHSEEREDGAKIEDANGLNIEGLAITGERLWVGLRGPVVQGPGGQDTAFIVSMDREAPFTADQPIEARLHEVPLGQDTGIRDLASLGDGRLLVLAGPRTDEGSDYHLAIFDPATGSTTTFAKLPPRGDSFNQEGLLVLGQNGEEVNLLIVQDGAISGGPYEVRVRIPTKAPAGTPSVADCPPGAS